MIVYKGTDKDMKCRGFQFDLGKEYVEEEAKLCEKGFHGCEYPLDVFGHYAPADSRFFVADLDGVTDEMQSDDTKRVGTKVTLRAEIGIPGIVKAAVEYIKERTGKTEDATGYQSAATNTGDQSAAAITFTMAFAASGTVRTGVFQHVINVIRKYSDLLANPSVMVEQPRYRYDELNVLEIPNEQVQEAFDVWVSFRDSARFRKTSSLTITSLIQMLHYLRSINHQISNCSHLP